MNILNEEGPGTLPGVKTDFPCRALPRSEVRKEYRRKQFARAEKSASLAATYPRLKALTVDLLYFDNQFVSYGHGLKYRANLDAARSNLQFNCPSTLCHRGGFNLTEQLRAAVATHQKAIKCQISCHGSRDGETGMTTRCKSVLHFKMTLAFKPKGR